MKRIVIAASTVLALLVTPVAHAQYGYRPVQPIQPLQTPSSGSTYDAQSGNMYNWQRDSFGNTNVQGMNIQNGSMWNQTIDPRGNQRGTDAQGNMWNYDNDTGTYMNYGTGTLCTGKGAARVCN